VSNQIKFKLSWNDFCSFWSFFRYFQWDEDKIGWHESDVHKALRLHGNQLIPNLDHSSLTDDDETLAAPTTRVFLPLCGKSVDLSYLARQTKVVAGVVGVDGVQKALKEFSTENPDLEIHQEKESDTKSSTAEHSAFTRFTGKNILLLKGNYFDLNEDATDGKFHAIFDRASMVAIDPSLREAYVGIIGKLIAPGGRILLVTIERRSGTEEDKNGPPFSIPEKEVRKLYEGQSWVDSITRLDNNDGSEENMISLHFLIQAKE